MMRSLSMVVCLSIIGLLLLSCLPAASAPTPQPAGSTAVAVTSTPKPAEDRPRYGGTLKVAHREDPAHFDPLQSNTISLFALIAPVYNGVLNTELRDNNKIIADLAERWEVSPDGLRLTFYVRKDVKWHDGTPFTSEDLRYYLDRSLNPPKGTTSLRRDRVARISGLDASDPGILRVTLAEPDPDFLLALADPYTVVPPKHGYERYGSMRSNVMGTGPFKFDSFERSVRFSVVKNPQYYVKGLPYLDRIDFFILKDRATQLAAFRAGQVDITACGLGATLSPHQIQLLENEMAGRVRFHRYGHTQFAFGMNSQRTPWSDVRVRTAVSLAVDRRALINVVEGGLARLSGFLHPSSPFAIPQDELQNRPGYRQPKDADMAEAKKLLAEAGYPNGFDDETISATMYTSVGEAMANELSKVGIRLKLKVMTLGEMDSLLERSNFSSLISSGGNTPGRSPTEIAAYIGSRAAINRANWRDQKTDTLLDRQGTIADMTERVKATRELERYLLEQSPMAVLYAAEQVRASAIRVRDWDTGTNVFNNLRHDVTWVAN